MTEVEQVSRIKYTQQLPSVPPSFSIYLMNKKRAQPRGKYFDYNTSTVEDKPQPKEEYNVFEIPVSQGQPYVIPNTRIGIVSDTPINNEQTHRQLLEEVNNHLKQLKEALGVKDQRNVMPTNPCVPMKNQIDGMAHNEVLEAANDLCTVRKHLQEALISDEKRKNYNKEIIQQSMTQSGYMMADGAYVRDPMDLKYQKEYQSEKQESPVNVETDGSQKTSQISKSSPVPTRQKGIYLMTDAENHRSMSNSYKNDLGNLYKDKYIQNANKQIDESIAQIDRMPSPPETRGSKVVHYYHEESVPPDQTKVLPSSTEERDFVSGRVKRALYDPDYKKHVRFASIIDNSKSLAQRDEERMYKIARKPTIDLWNRGVNIVSGQKLPEGQTQEEYAMTKYKERAAKLIEQQLIEQEKEKVRKQRHYDNLERQYQERRLNDQKQQIKVFLKNKFIQEMANHEVNVKKHLIDIMLEKQTKQKKNKQVIVGRCERPGGRPASPDREIYGDKSKLPSFTQKQMQQITKEYLKYMKYNEQDYKRFSDEILNNMLDESVTGLIQRQKAQIEESKNDIKQ